MTTPQHGTDGGSRIERAVTGVVVGVVGLALVGLIVGVVGYHLVVSGWAEPSAASATPSPEPTATRAARDERPAEGLDSSNEAYRQRTGSAESDAQAALSLPDVQAALDPLATRAAITPDDVVAALAAAGFDTVQVSEGTVLATSEPTTLAVGVGVPGGCVFGAVGPDGVTLEAGGPIADGGCLPMPGH